jgi:hypothetical protein
MIAVYAPLFGFVGVLAGAILTARLTARREYSQWLRDAKLQASIDMINALQLLIRRMINIAYLGDDSGSYENKDFAERMPKSEHALKKIEDFDNTQIEWNNAQHEALLLSSPEVTLITTGPSIRANGACWPTRFYRADRAVRELIFLG